MLAGLFGHCLIERGIGGLMVNYEKVRYCHGYPDGKVSHGFEAVNDCD